MLFPALGFLTGCIAFSIAGIALLALVDSVEFSLANLAIFVVAGMLGTVLVGTVLGAAVAAFDLVVFPLLPLGFGVLFGLWLGIELAKIFGSHGPTE